jgi:hypothetical protein
MSLKNFAKSCEFFYKEQLVRFRRLFAERTEHINMALPQAILYLLTLVILTSFAVAIITTRINQGQSKVSIEMAPAHLVSGQGQNALPGRKGYVASGAEIDTTTFMTELPPPPLDALPYEVREPLNNGVSDLPPLS